ncbi:unnamed protein product [Paramecium primaurelia]|uniref:Nucleoporin Nup54 alpha-helical domain-containing protein n=1 Tax=Paramecium primaurelia TaxID=5886 RepID=A0A8S1Q8Z4_PARPR|nr:unnamed protein product [Paramecium primaurelia]
MNTNGPQQGLFGNKPPQTNTIFSATPAVPQQNNLFPNTQPTQQNNMLFGQTTNQPQPMTGGFGQTPLLGQPVQNQGIFGQQQPATSNLFGNTQPGFGQQTNLFATTPQQQQPGIMQNGLQYPQQNQIQALINDSNAFKEKYNALTLKIGETEKSFANQPGQNQQWQQTIQPISQIVFQMDTKSVLDTSEQILAGQKDLSKNLNEYISTVGLVQKITEDGLEVLKKEEAQCNDFQKAQQTMKESYDQLSGTIRINQQFSVPQKYQEQLILQQYEQLELLTTTVNNMIKYYEKQPNMDVDEALQYKLMHLQTLSNYQCMLSSRIRNIQEKISTFQTKTYSQIMPDKKIDEFYTIDTHKDLLDQIISEKI